MLRAAAMKRIEILVLERHLRAVTEGLGRLGLIHLTRSQAAEGGELVEPSALEDQLSRVRSLQDRVTTLCDTLGIGEDHRAEDVPHVSLGELERRLQPIEKQLQAATQRRRQLDSEIESQYQVLRDLESFRGVDVPPSELEGLEFLHFALGALPPENLDDVREALGDQARLLPFRTPDGEQRLIAFTTRAGRFALDSILEENDFRPEELPDLGPNAPAEVVRKTQDRLVQLAQDQDALRDQTAALAEEHGGRLAAWRRRLRVDEQVLEAQAYFGHTRSTVLISGYAPSERVDAVRQEVLRLTDGRAVIEVSETAEDDPEAPTLMQNPRLLKPFERLVAGYGTPGYREIEPTPLVAVGFLLMFGVMFGDIGHGAVLAVLGAVAARRGRSEAVRDIGLLLAMAGGTAVLFGWVYGSLFGVEGALRPPVGGWFPPMAGANITRLLLAAIVLGVGVISLGVVLNIVNRIRARDYFGGVVDKFGVVGFIFYWGALGLGIRFALSESASPSGLEVALLVGLPLLVLFFREPLHALMTRKDRTKRPTLLGGLIEGFVDVLETVSAYVANTVSFVRVGAFALAHAALCVAIFSTERVVRDLPGGPVWSVLVVVGGNALVIGLEGLVVSIQAMRLEYYEFFSKFFKGEGKAFDPFKLS